MQSTDDSALLREYAGNNSDAAFAALVARHINLVYSVALRQVGNPHHAEEVTQVVFIILAKKAGAWRHDRALSSWLFRATRLTAGNFVRSEIRRQRRESEAFMQTVLNEPENEAWPSIAPLLDTAVANLNEQDRRAILLRFYEGRNSSEVGAALGASEDAAKKRVTRAVEKLRGWFAKRGVTLTATVLTAAISANSVQAAPAVLAKTITAVAVTKGVAASGSTLTLIKGALKIMAWSKVKTAVVVGVGVLLAVGTTTLTVKEVSHHHEESLWDKIMRSDLQDLKNAPAGVSIRPSALTREMAGMHEGYGKVLGVYQPFETLIARAYNVSAWRVLALSPLPTGEFDYLATTSQHQRESLQQMIKSKFGLNGRRESRETDVLELKVKRPGASGLKASSKTDGNSTSAWEIGSLHRVNGPISFLTYDLENCLQVPVIDRTGLGGRFDYDLKWDDEIKWDSAGRKHFSNPDGLKKALLEQLGLELVPARESLEVLVVTKK